MDNPMHVKRFIDEDRRIVYTTITGEITLADVRADMMRLVADPAYSPDMPGLVDMRSANTKLTTADIQQIAGLVTTNPKVVGRTRRALLVDDDVMFGIYRMFEAYTVNAATEFRVFRDEEQARAWIEELAVTHRQNA